jgi:hypothetical protein
MGVQILFSGLCVVQLMGGSPPTSARLSCPNQTSHVMRLTVAAKDIKAAPAQGVDWLVAPDGTEYASFALKKSAEVVFLGADGKPLPVGAFKASNLTDLVRASQLGLTLKERPQWGFELPMKEGTLEAAGEIPYCYLIEGNKVHFKENLIWTGSTAAGLRIKQAGMQDDVVLKSASGTLRVSVTNDVRQTTSGDILSAANEFGHWGMTTIFTGNFSTMGHCDIATLTRKPICNLLLVP